MKWKGRTRSLDPVPLPALRSPTDGFPASLLTPLPYHPLLRGTASPHRLAPPTLFPPTLWPVPCCQVGAGNSACPLLVLLSPPVSPHLALFIVCSMSWCPFPLMLDPLPHSPGVTTTEASAPASPAPVSPGAPLLFQTFMAPNTF